jgi:hypothetical protein
VCFLKYKFVCFLKYKLVCFLKLFPRENELLKHQLRKYVTAVQLLNKQHNATPSSSEAESEARLYEAKLGQLAEMHSELLEMNQRLKLDLITKEVNLKLFFCQYFIISYN